MQLQRSPFEIKPGVTKILTEFEAKNRYTSCDKVRFYKGRAEKIGGWLTYIAGMLGVCRTMFTYTDNNFNPELFAGTNIRLYNIDNTPTLHNITPWMSTGTLVNPFSTTSGSPIVDVAHVAHGLSVGQYVNFSGASAVGGITVNGEYTVTSLNGVDAYKITHSSNASSTAGPGGGAAVSYQYELMFGNQNLVMGGGWGVGTWGTGTWGTIRSSNTFYQFPRVWFLDKLGQDLIALPYGGKLYEWSPGDVRASVIAGAPTASNAMFVTSERMIVLLGVNGEPMDVAWCDDEDRTNWTPSNTSTANTRRLQEGSRLINGCRLAQGVNLIWSDYALFLLQYTGDAFIYATPLIAREAGLIGPLAFAVAGGTALWMSGSRFFMYSGSLSEIPNSDDIRSDVYDNLNAGQASKCHAFYNTNFNEIQFNYPRGSANECSHYVAVNLDDFSWTEGTLPRGAFTTRYATIDILFGSDETGTIYQHEYGANADGAAISWYLETGYVQIDDGNQSMNVWSYIPNYKRHAEDVLVTITTLDEPEDTTPLEMRTYICMVGDTKCEGAVAGRLMKLKLEADAVDSDFRLGAQQIEVSPAGGRP